MGSERLYRLRNYQSKDFWAMLFARPMTIALLYPVADCPWVTPDRITAASAAAKAAGIAALLAMPGHGGSVLGAVLLNLGLVLDNMDGTLARYRCNSTYMGYFLDKSLDAIGLACMFVAMSLRSWLAGLDTTDVVVPLIGYCGASVAAYSKWVAHSVEMDAELRKRLNDGTLEDFARGRIDQNPSVLPPRRTPADWLRFVRDAFKSLLAFNEVDIFFFLLLAAVLDSEWIFTRVMCSFYALGLVVGPVHFFVALRSRLAREGLR